MIKITGFIMLLLTQPSFAQSAQQESPAGCQKKTPAGEMQPCEIPTAKFLPTGFIFSALLPDAIYSYNLNAPLVAILEEDVKFKDHVVLPKNTRVIGSASALHTLDRVNINWTLIVLPDGCEFPFSAIALSAEDGSAGVKGKLEEHKGSIAAHIALKSVLSGAQTAVSLAAPLEGSVLSGITTEANQNISEDISKVKSYESVYVRERTPIRVFVLRRFVRDVSNH